MAPKKKAAAEGKSTPRKGPKGMPKPVDAGQILTDLRKKQWRLGTKIDQGGFGYLHLGSDQVEVGKSFEEKYVIKVEPHSNGPLFVELAFYQRAAKPETISNWKKSNSLKHLGVPGYIGSGSFEYKAMRYRFLVMDRFDENVEHKFLRFGKSFSLVTVLSLGITVVNCLEYMHENEYVHADIKASNLLTGYEKKMKDVVYLVDYGLAFRYSPAGKHIAYKEDPKRKHDGTIEYTSRDAHKGVAPSRRSDLEVLGYCMLQWLAGSLPWESKIKDKEVVAREKESFMKDVSKSLRATLNGKPNCIEVLEEYMKYINTLKYEDKPDYKKIRSMFTKGLKKQGTSFDGMAVHFSPGDASVAKAPLANGMNVTPAEIKRVPKRKAETQQKTSPSKSAKSTVKGPSARTTRFVRRTKRNEVSLKDTATSP